MNLPPYLELPGSRSFSPPFRFTGMNQQVFFLRASYDRLKIVTDRWLNGVPGSEYRFVPLLPFVICSPAWIDRIQASDGPRGWMHESEIDFAFFVAAFRGLELDRVAVAFAYLLVDNPQTVVEGREIYGYRKTFSTMEYVAGTWQPSAASAWVFPADAPDEEFRLTEVTRILAPPAWGSATRSATWEDFQGITSLVNSDLEVDAGMAVDRLISLFRTQVISSVHVLQVRDTQYPASAGYQALIDAPMSVDMHSFRFLPPGFAVKLTDYASYPLISDLGIEIDANNVAQSVLSFQSYYDAVLQPGRVLAVGGRTSPS